MTRIDALQTALAAEHAAVFVYGALGAQTSRSAEPERSERIAEAYRTHQDRRDRLIAIIDRAGAEPVPAEAGYHLPADLGTPAAVDQRALRLERACGRTYAYVVASTTGRHRRWAVEALLDASVRELAFGGEPRGLPGL